MNAFLNIYRLLRRFFKTLIGKDIFPFCDIRLNQMTLGNKGAAWTIYPDVLDQESIVYSVGVGTDISFDRKLIENFGMTVYAFDPTPKSIEWVKSQETPKKFRLYEYGLSAVDGEIIFTPPENPNFVSYSAVVNENDSKNRQKLVLKVKSVKSIMHELKHDKIDLLKMDIEGAEYDVVSSIIESDIRPGQLLVEVHHRMYGLNVNQSKNLIRSLRKVGYELFSISPNGEELSFINSEIIHR